MLDATRPTIGFDGLFFEQPMTGAGQYATHLWRELRDNQQEIDPHLLFPAGAPPDVYASALPARWTTVSEPAHRLHGHARKLWWEQAGLPLAARRAGASLVHVPYFAAPALQRTPYVVTIHDVIPLVLPEYGGSGRMRWYLRLVGRTARRARLVLTDSDYSRDDIVRVLGIPPERVRVTPLAVSERFTPASSEADHAALARVRERYGLHTPFVLNVGGFDLRKRLPELLRGFAAALPRLPADLMLVIVGRPHTGNRALYPPLEPLLAELGIGQRVSFTGFVSEEDKRDLYRAAELFVFTSEYEGFGLTPLEAMACGAPVICSNRSSLPEVVGDAGLAIDPEPEAIAGALVELLDDPALRAELARRSLARAAEFSWQRTARLTLDAYQEALR